MALAPGKASELKQIIHQQLTKMDVHSRVREVLAETIREELAPEHQQLSEEHLMKALIRRGIIDDVMKELSFVTQILTQQGGIFTFRFSVEKLFWNICRNLSLYLVKLVLLSPSVYIFEINVSALNLCHVPVNQISMMAFYLKYIRIP
uniref:CEP76 N-terminal domain-containing protein n=1 Tax=Anolis carolinensis TaxID=28377 RepID=A0A803TWT3_ANOCA